MLGSIFLAIAGLILRLINLANPKGLVFDELYYVNGARDYLKYGVEVSSGKPEFVVHPPVAKWLIALGIKIFGDNEFGWRIAAAVAGSLCIYLIGRIAFRLFGEPIWATLAALLMFLDGFALVMSRTAIIDIFLTLFILLSANAWLKASYWELGLWLGLAISTKWNAIYFLIAILGYELFINRNWLRTIRTGLIALIIYPITWIGWFKSDLGFDRHASSNPIFSFFKYQQQILNFHTGLTQKHTYQANPWGWIFMRRPTSFYYQSPPGCKSNKCSKEVLALGTPILWWLFSISLIFLIWLVIKRLEFENIFILLMVAAGYLPWFFFQKRTVFTFYAIVFEPFLILALVVLAKYLYEMDSRFKYLIGFFVLAITINFYYDLPLFLGQLIDYRDWLNKMWFKSWI